MGLESFFRVALRIAGHQVVLPQDASRSWKRTPAGQTRFISNSGTPSSLPIFVNRLV
jgi:hypothetical protein